jgi:hypothetical protein
MRVLIFSGSREIVHVMVPPIGEAYLAAHQVLGSIIQKDLQN